MSDATVEEVPAAEEATPQKRLQFTLTTSKDMTQEEVQKLFRQALDALGLGKISVIVEEEDLRAKVTLLVRVNDRLICTVRVADTADEKEVTKAAMAHPVLLKEFERINHPLSKPWTRRPIFKKGSYLNFYTN